MDQLFSPRDCTTWLHSFVSNSENEPATTFGQKKASENKIGFGTSAVSGAAKRVTQNGSQKATHFLQYLSDWRKQWASFIRFCILSDPKSDLTSSMFAFVSSILLVTILHQSWAIPIDNGVEGEFKYF